MKTSEAGRARIAHREGRRLDAYRDMAGVWTVGVGHTGRMSPPPVTAGMTIDEAQCAALLVADLKPVEDAIRDSVKVPLTQNEYDALASLGFNIGIGGLKRSTLVRRLNAGDIQGAAEAFSLWSKPAVLASRRADERAQFLAPDPTAAEVAPARAAILSHRAEAARQGAQTARSGAAAMTAGGAAAVVIAHHHHRHGAILIFGIAALLAGAVAAFVAWARRRQSQALATHVPPSAPVSMPDQQHQQ